MGVNCGFPSIFMTDHGIALSFFPDLPWVQMVSSLLACCNQPACLLISAGLLVIMTICVTMRMLSSNVEYLSARLYNSSIIAGGSKDNEWKK